MCIVNEKQSNTLQIKLQSNDNKIKESRWVKFERIVMYTNYNSKLWSIRVMVLVKRESNAK